jgi:hypothetical protein
MQPWDSSFLNLLSPLNQKRIAFDDKKKRRGGVGKREGEVIQKVEALLCYHGVNDQCTIPAIPDRACSSQVSF